jgi:hypothetical protein
LSWHRECTWSARRAAFAVEALAVDDLAIASNLCIVNIVADKDDEASFSADTGMAECLVIGRKSEKGTAAEKAAQHFRPHNCGDCMPHSHLRRVTLRQSSRRGRKNPSQRRPPARYLALRTSPPMCKKNSSQHLT